MVHSPTPTGVNSVREPETQLLKFTLMIKVTSVVITESCGVVTVTKGKPTGISARLLPAQERTRSDSEGEEPEHYSDKEEEETGFKMLEGSGEEAERDETWGENEEELQNELVEIEAPTPSLIRPESKPNTEGMVQFQVPRPPLSAKRITLEERITNWETALIAYVVKTTGGRWREDGVCMQAGKIYVDMCVVKPGKIEMGLVDMAVVEEGKEYGMRLGRRDRNAWRNSMGEEDFGDWLGILIEENGTWE